MKKIGILLLAISMALILVLTPRSYAYTLSNTNGQYYNQVTQSYGTADVLDIGSNYIEYMYYNLHHNTINPYIPIRAVFSNVITTELLPSITSVSKVVTVDITFINTGGTPIYTHTTYVNGITSLSYFETNFVLTNQHYIKEIYVKISNLEIGFDEDVLHENLNGFIIAYGASMIINQTISTTQYGNGWADAMNSKVTQIWSLWGNIFDTFMNVFDIFSVKLMGDITIGHIAMVPLVLGLIGFIYALGGKRGR